MATRRTAPIQPPAPGADDEWRAPVGALQTTGLPDPDDDDDDEESPLDRVIALLRGAPSDRAVLKLYRKIPGNASGEWCADLSLSEFEAGGFETIREQYGPGAYFVWLYGPHPVSGKMGRLAHDSFNIAAPLRSETANAPQHQTELSAVLRLMQEQNAAVLAALTQRPDPQAQMRDTIALMASMREAMGLNGAQAAPAAAPNPSAMLGELVGAIKQLRDVSNEINPPPAPGIDPESPMAMVGQIIDLVKTVAANPGALSMLGGGQHVQPQQLHQMAPLSLPHSLAAPVAETLPNPAPGDTLPPVESQSESLEAMALRGSLQGLIDMATQGAAPDKGGEYIADTLPDDLLPYLRLPNWFDMLAHVAKSFGLDVAPHRAWIEAAKVHADALLSAPDPD